MLRCDACALAFQRKEACIFLHNNVSLHLLWFPMVPSLASNAVQDILCDTTFVVADAEHPTLHRPCRPSQPPEVSYEWWTREWTRNWKWDCVTLIAYLSRHKLSDYRGLSPLCVVEYADIAPMWILTRVFSINHVLWDDNSITLIYSPHRLA